MFVLSKYFQNGPDIATQVKVLYSQNFILFKTYEWVQLAGVLASLKQFQHSVSGAPLYSRLLALLGK
jgi:hypothetical protein